MDKFMIDRFTGRGGNRGVKSFSPYDSSASKDELEQAMLAAKRIKDRAKQKNEQQAPSNSGINLQKLIEKANALKDGNIIKNEEKKIDPSETDEQIAAKVEFAKKANEARPQTLDTGSTTEEILEAALKDLF